jgi:hypothetical protein
MNNDQLQLNSSTQLSANKKTIPLMISYTFVKHIITSILNQLYIYQPSVRNAKASADKKSAHLSISML